MLAVCHVDIGDDVDDAAVGLLGEALVLAAVAGLHVEDGDVQALCANDAKAGVGVAENEYSIRLGGCKELVGAVDDVAAGGTEVIAYGIHVDFWVFQLQVLEEHAVEVVVVVLAGMGEDDIEVLTALVDDCGKADYLGAGSHHNDEPQLAVFLPLYVGIVCFHNADLLFFEHGWNGWNGFFCASVISFDLLDSFFNTDGTDFFADLIC